MRVLVRPENEKQLMDYCDKWGVSPTSLINKLIKQLDTKETQHGGYNDARDAIGAKPTTR
ncbi:hypothetical protein XM75_c10146 [Vibrio vulnificus]|uniref:hypothetical protein n=1 Tax=Vibrio rotiferianus TaxID=190895 RepID=UPI0009D050E8|nr:hypothetical protein XM75_c10146 [Vibrio vulnificus]